MELYYQEFGDLTEGAAGYGEALEKEDCNELLGCCNLLRHRGFGGASRSAPKGGRISVPAALSQPCHERAQPESARAMLLVSRRRSWRGSLGLRTSACIRLCMRGRSRRQAKWGHTQKRLTSLNSAFIKSCLENGDGLSRRDSEALAQSQSPILKVQGARTALQIEQRLSRHPTPCPWNFAITRPKPASACAGPCPSQAGSRSRNHCLEISNIGQF